VDQFREELGDVHCVSLLERELFAHGFGEVRKGEVLATVEIEDLLLVKCI
jgi:hypothetical protein